MVSHSSSTVGIRQILKDIPAPVLPATMLEAVERLQDLREFFLLNGRRIDARQLFHINSWSNMSMEALKKAHPDYGPDQLYREFVNAKEDLHPDGLFKTPHPCGTTGCVLGWAGFMPKFNALGLVTDPITNDVRLGKPSQPDSCTNMRAGSKFFGITQAMGSHLFSPDRYPSQTSTITPNCNDVIRHLDHVIWVLERASFLYYQRTHIPMERQPTLLQMYEMAPESAPTAPEVKIAETLLEFAFESEGVPRLHEYDPPLGVKDEKYDPEEYPVPGEVKSAASVFNALEDEDDEDDDDNYDEDSDVYEGDEDDDDEDDDDE
jgi:hypothetical protein